MPLTPFHFGIGLLAKAAAPSRSSFLAFVASQIVIDCETAYFLFVAREWPVHRWAHTFAVGAPIGIVVGLAVARLSHGVVDRIPVGPAEAAVWPCMVGGLLGGLTHPVLDGIMHSDVQPLRPFLGGNPFLGVVDLGLLHLCCLAAGGLGAALLLARAGIRRQRAR